MFGYVKADTNELKVRELDRYRSFYCGLCEILRKKFGLFGQATLSYDITFLVLFLSSLYELPEKGKTKRCKVHPVRKRRMIMNEATAYAADMEMLLSDDHLLDDWKDERKISSGLLHLLIKRKVRRLKFLYPQQSHVIQEQLKALSDAEERQEDSLDIVSDCFGHLMGEIFLWKKEDPFADKIRRFGFCLGKFVYLMDAYDDYEKDQKSGSYNVFKTYPDPKKRKELAHDVLSMMMAECAEVFEYLPLTQDREIIRNIIYLGVWRRWNELEKIELEKIALQKEERTLSSDESKG